MRDTRMLDTDLRRPKAAMLAVLAVAALLLCAFVSASAGAGKAYATGGSFYVAAAGDEGAYALETSVISYTSGQTVQEALEASEIDFAFSGSTLSGVNGYTPDGYFSYYFTDYESHEIHTLDEVQASSIDALFISSYTVTLGDGHVHLVKALGDYISRTDGVRNYESANTAYVDGAEKLSYVDESSAQNAADNLNGRISDYDVMMNGTKYAVTFTVTQGSPASSVTDAVVSMTDAYGNVTDAVSQGGGVYTAEVVKIDKTDGYSYEVTDAAGHNGVRCTSYDVSGTGAQSVSVSLPGDVVWIGSQISLYSRSVGSLMSGGAVNLSSRTVSYIVPDIAGPEADLYVNKPLPPNTVYNLAADALRSDGNLLPTETQIYARASVDYTLYAVYAGTDGKSYEYAVPYNSQTYAPEYLVDIGTVGASYAYEVRHFTDSEKTQYQFEACNASITRSGTLSDLSVKGDGVEMMSGFAPATQSYSLRTSADSVSITPTPLGDAQDGYALQVGGAAITIGSSYSVSLPDRAKTIPLEVQVNVKLNETLTTYTLEITKVEPCAVTLTHDNDVSVEVVNAAGSAVVAASSTAGSTTFNLDAGGTYTYIATKASYYHSTCSFTASDGLSVQAKTPSTTDVVRSLAFSQANAKDDWADGSESRFEVSAGSTLHDQTVIVPDYYSQSVWVRAYQTDESQTGYTYTASFTAQDTGNYLTASLQYVSNDLGQKISGSLKVDKKSGGNFVTASGYHNSTALNVTTGSDSDGTSYCQSYHITAQRTLSLPSIALSDGTSSIPLVQGNAVTADATYGFNRTVYDYVVPVREGTESVVVAYTFPTPVSDDSLSSGGYSVTLDGQTTQYEQGKTFTQTVQLDVSAGSSNKTSIPVTVSHVDGDTPDVTYNIVVEQMPAVSVPIAAQNVTDATVIVRDSTTSTRVYPEADGTFRLVSGYSYDYTIAASGYVGQKGTITAATGVQVSVTLEQVSGAQPTELSASWPYFRADENNNAAVDYALPTSSANTLLYWATQLGEGYSAGAAGCPILVDGYIYSYAGDQIYKLDTVTGEKVAQGTMIGTSSFAITPMTYAEGMVFVALSNGRVEAFDATTLESLWVYKSPYGGQPNCPITYFDGCIYTGFWNGAKTCDFVCLTVTDEHTDLPGHDPTDTTKISDEKIALWSYSHAGGFYWAGAVACENYVLVGSDDAAITAGLEITDEGKASGTLFSFDPKTGEVLDSLKNEYPGSVNIGNIRCTITRDEASGRYYYCGRGGYLCSVAVGDDGVIDRDSIQLVRLQNGASSVSSTSTPLVYNGRVYVGADSGSYGAYDGQSVNVINVNDDFSLEIAYVVNMQGRAQSSPILTTAYSESEGCVYVYFFDNYTPGKLRYFKDSPGQTSPSGVVTEEYEGKAYSDMASVLFAPQGAQAEYCICSPIADEYGTIYFKNDSAYMMAIGPTITKIEVTQNPTKTFYNVGDTFDKTGMTVIATYSNGTQRDVTDYVTVTEEAFESTGTVQVPVVFEHTMYQASSTGQDVGTADTSYNFAHPTTYVEVQVGDPTAPSIKTSSLDTAEAGDAYSVTLSADGVPDVFTWAASGLPSGLSLNATSGVISGTLAAGSGGEYTIRVSCTNSEGTDTKELALRVIEDPSFVTGSSGLPAGELGVEYSATIESSGYPSPKMVVYSGTDTYGNELGLPDGLSLDVDTGQISGTPLESGKFYLRANLSNEAGSSTQRTFTILINSAPQIITTQLPSCVAGVEYSATQLEASAYPAEVTWSWAAAAGSALPSGLSLSAGGQISGTPSTAGSYTVVVTAQNEYGGVTHSGSKTYTIEVSEQTVAPTIDTQSLFSATLGSDYSQEIVASGTPSPEISVEGLPQGLSYSVATGLITGQASQTGEFSVTVTATNVAGTASKSYTLKVVDPPSIATEVLGTPIEGEEGCGYVVLGEAVSLPIEVSGYPDPTVVVGGLPQGLSYDASAHTITGTPTQASAEGSTVTISADNGQGATATKTFTLKVYEAAKIGAVALGDAVFGQAYSADLKISGTPAPSVQITGLSDDFKYNALTGCLEGTPSGNTGVFSVTITANNMLNETAAKLETTLLIGSAPSFSPATLDSATLLASYNAEVKVSGYPLPESIELGGLPQGLSYTYDSKSGKAVIFGTPSQAGSYTVSIKASNSFGTCSQDYALEVLDDREAPKITTASLATALQNNAYEAVVEASGKPAPTFSATGLPSGLSMSESGVISGTTSQTGSFQVQVVATNSKGSDMSTLTLEVSAQPVAVTMGGSGTLFAAAAGVAYSASLADILQPTGVPASFTWGLAAGSNLPSGLVLDATSGVISGTPASTGDFSFTVSCTNGVGAAAQADVTLFVYDPPRISTTELEDGISTKDYTATISASGYPAPQIYSADLPSGLTLDSKTGLLTGRLEAGEYSFTVTAYNGYGTQAEQTFTLKISQGEGSTDRLYGEGGLDTMRAIVQDGWDSSDTVVLATFDGYWDALAASGLAGIYSSPVLMTDPNSLSEQTRSEIVRLGASKVYITGGTVAVSANVESQVWEIPGVTNVERVKGEDARDTAVKIYEEGAGMWGKTAIVASSSSFHDALAASPYAYAKRAPIFLAHPDSHALEDYVLEKLRDGGFTRVLICGGSVAISQDVETQLKEIGFSDADIIRKWGDSAIETSSDIAQFCIDEGMEATYVGVATGVSYYDALSAAAYCGKNNSPLILVTGENRSSIGSFVTPHKNEIEQAVVFGGVSAVDAQTYAVLAAALRRS